MTPRLSIVLSFVAGFVDTATFVGADGLFSAHVTGNFVLFAAYIFRGLRPTDYLKLMAFPVFIVSVYFAAFLNKKMSSKNIIKPRVILSIDSALILICGLLTWIFNLKPQSDIIFNFESIMLMSLVFAMGLQNAFHRLNMNPVPATTIMTGNVTQLTVELFEIWFGVGPSVNRQQHVLKAKQLFNIILCFATGCVFSALLTFKFGLSSLMIPGVIFSVALLLEKKKDE